MPTLVMEPDAFADTIYYFETMGKDAPAFDENKNTFYHAYKKRPALAMIGAKVHDLLVSHMDINGDNAAVIIYNLPDMVGFQLMCGDDCNEIEIQEFDDFCRGLMEFAEDHIKEHGNITMQGGDIFFAAQSEEPLLKFLVDFAAHNEFNFDCTGIRDEYGDDYKKFHASLDSSESVTWEEAAESALQCSWVMAVLPEKPYPTREAVLKEAYRIRHSGIYSVQQIEDAISVQAGYTHRPIATYGAIFN
jgi:hypothetical protein